jgi:hypothetical protein
MIAAGLLVLITSRDIMMAEIIKTSKTKRSPKIICAIEWPGSKLNVPFATILTIATVIADHKSNKNIDFKTKGLL